MPMANLSQEYANIILPNTVFITTAGILGVVGNIIVILLYCCKVADKNGNRYFIPILAATDLLGSLSMTVYNVTDNYFFFNYPSETCCRLLHFSLMFTGFLSASFLLIIAVQRYKKVCHVRSSELTLFCRRISVCSTVVASAVITIPWLALSGTPTISIQFQERNVSGNICKYIDMHNVRRYHHLLFVYMGFICAIMMIILVVLVVLYALIALRLRKLFYVTETEREPLICGDSEGTHAGVHCGFNVMYAVIVLVYIVSFVPTIVLFVLDYSHVNYLNFPKNALITWTIFGRFSIINHFMNPLIYICFDVKFRRAFRQLCNCNKTFHSTEMSVPS